MKKIKMALLMLCLATIIMAWSSVYVYAYNDRLKSSWNAEGGIAFSLAETEPVENCPEIFDPLDPWTKQAIENLSDYVEVYWSNYSDCKLLSIGQKIFKYQNKFYTFDDGICFDPAPPPSIPLGPIYGGWTGVSLGWIATGLIYKKKRKNE